MKKRQSEVRLNRKLPSRCLNPARHANTQDFISHGAHIRPQPNVFNYEFECTKSIDLSGTVFFESSDAIGREIYLERHRIIRKLAPFLQAKLSLAEAGQTIELLPWEVED
jgi:hypothetical protein